MLQSPVQIVGLGGTVFITYIICQLQGR